MGLRETSGQRKSSGTEAPAGLKPIFNEQEAAEYGKKQGELLKQLPDDHQDKKQAIKNCAEPEKFAENIEKNHKPNLPPLASGEGARKMIEELCKSMDLPKFQSQDVPRHPDNFPKTHVQAPVPGQAGTLHR